MLLVLAVLAGLLACCVTISSARVRPGIEVLLEDSLACVMGRRLGLVTNQTGIDGEGRSTIRRLHERRDLRLLRLFSPEHGLDGSRPAGETVRDEIHGPTGLPVSSLYQGSRAVEPTLLAGLDVVLFDIQDIGLRPYTYTSTLAEVMKGARRADVEVIVLDRPNPLGGWRVAGLTLDPAFASFIGPYPVPYLPGMTVGELARLFNEAFGIGCRLKVIPMSGWSRAMTFVDTGLPWVPTSPNVPTWDTPLAMSITGPLGELGAVSIGIGTASPFWVAGSDQLDGNHLAERFNDAQLPGLRAQPWTWTPSSGSWNGRTCRGIRLLVTDWSVVDPGGAQLALLEILSQELDSLASRGSVNQRRMFDKAMGTDQVRLALEGGGGMELLRRKLGLDDKAWRDLRRPYLLYPD
jgi:uncharacterized protein YbbC (DUF1343 family)